MKIRALKLIHWSLLIIVLLPVLLTAHEGEEDASQEQIILDAESQAVADVLEEFARAFEEGNIDAIGQMTSAKSRFSHFEGTFADWSWESYAGHLAKEMPSFSETQYQITNIRPETAGDMAFATYDWAMDVVVLSEEFEGGKHPVNMRGIGTAVFLKANDGWKIRHIHSARAQSSPAEH